MLPVLLAIASKPIILLDKRGSQSGFGITLFCHFGKIQRIHVDTAYEKSRFHPGLTKEGLEVESLTQQRF